ncbi:Hypothetical protein Bdt_1117 [Bdellovibrio bacteriovorus str. Tiberius]|uniref:Uncharacterized protein n=2 Tax=Bdellovibrio bacteriovorus TaxID=959 RepID=K7ZET8_BDEBC|nr:Hypothetical protein Bdt_1117 [Bdellovibrio bacteriovorus str. Tiberius]
MVWHLSFLKGALPENVEFQSFYVPYYSASSELELDVLFVKGTHFSKEGSSVVLKEPEVLDEDGKRMSLDILDGKFFVFLEEYSR